MDSESNFFEKTPFYMTYPMQNLYEAEVEYEKDMERLKQWNPKEVAEFQRLVEERCDELEYEGSRMYDEEPDKLMLQNEAYEIYKRVVRDCIDGEKVPLASVKGMEELQSGQNYFEGVPSDFSMECVPEENNFEIDGGDSLNTGFSLEAAGYGSMGNRCDGWLCSVIEILFYNEVYRRRCRHRRCRRWW